MIFRLATIVVPIIYTYIVYRIILPFNILSGSDVKPDKEDKAFMFVVAIIITMVTALVVIMSYKLGDWVIHG